MEIMVKCKDTSRLVTIIILLPMHALFLSQPVWQPHYGDYTSSCSNDNSRLGDSIIIVRPLHGSHALLLTFHHMSRSSLDMSQRSPQVEHRALASQLQ